MPNGLAGATAGQTGVIQPAAPATPGVGATLVQGLAGGVLLAGLTARGGPLEAPRERLPKIRPGDILRAALGAQALSEQGLVPRITTDPFTGDLVVSTLDQAPVLQTILGEKFAREALRPSPAEVEEVRTFRDEIVQGLGVMSRVTARQVAPGVVARTVTDVDPMARLSGPCAGPTTGFQRLRCARGGMA